MSMGGRSNKMKVIWDQRVQEFFKWVKVLVDVIGGNHSFL